MRTHVSEAPTLPLFMRKSKTSHFNHKTVLLGSPQMWWKIVFIDFNKLSNANPIIVWLWNLINGLDGGGDFKKEGSGTKKIEIVIYKFLRLLNPILWVIFTSDPQTGHQRRLTPILFTCSKMILLLVLEFDSGAIIRSDPSGGTRRGQNQILINFFEVFE